MERNKKHYIALIKLFKTLRLSNGMSQLALAGKLKVNQSFISKYESGERRLDFLEIKQVCDALGLSLSQFVKMFEEEIER